MISYYYAWWQLNSIVTMWPKSIWFILDRAQNHLDAESWCQQTLMRVIKEFKFWLKTTQWRSRFSSLLFSKSSWYQLIECHYKKSLLQRWFPQEWLPSIILSESSTICETSLVTVLFNIETGRFVSVPNIIKERLCNRIHINDILYQYIDFREVARWLWYFYVSQL